MERYSSIDMGEKEGRKKGKKEKVVVNEGMYFEKERRGKIRRIR